MSGSPPLASWPGGPPPPDGTPAIPPRSRGRKVRDLADRRLRRALPRPVYQSMLGGYHSLRTLAGRGPGRGRLLPDFVIIGTAKSGTTSLYAWLCAHPYVEPAKHKEVHYFDYNYYRGVDWYRAHFPLRSERDAFAAQHGRPFITGEASPSYISHHWVPERLASLLPQAKLLVVLRDPVQRAYSQFQMSRREGEEPLESFAEAIAIEDQRLDPERAHLAADRRYHSWPIGCWSYLMRSRYAEQLERWFAHFPREQFHIVTLEQMTADPTTALAGVHGFLGLPEHVDADLVPLHSARYDALAPDVEQQLRDYFRPHNERLYELLGVDFGWDAAAVPPR